jgi:hypothetical protein
MVMVLFPGETWEIVKKISEMTNSSSQEVISVGLGLLHDRLMEEQSGS